MLFGRCRADAIRPDCLADRVASLKILIAVDGSPQALRAVVFATDLLRRMVSESGTVTLMNVHDDIGYRYAESFVGRDTVAQYLRDLALEDLKDGERILAEAGIPCRTEIRTGHVAREIVDFAAAGGFDLIVLGAKGRSALADLLLGSVAQRVLATAVQSVLLVR